MQAQLASRLACGLQERQVSLAASQLACFALLDGKLVHGRALGCRSEARTVQDVLVIGL